MIKKIFSFLFTLVALGFILIVVYALFLEEKEPITSRPEPPIHRPSLGPEEKTIESEHILFGYPSLEGTLLYRRGYVLSHNKDKKVANWVSYHMQEDYLWRKVDRTDDFRPDPQLRVGGRSELSDYDGCGYDRGHLVPADDMARSWQTMSESFLLSNITPQIGPGFNSGIWSSLENKVQQWTAERGNLYVMMGPLFLTNYYTVGRNNVAVPTHFFKIVVSWSPSDHTIDAIAFLLPHKSNPSKLLPNFITTIDQVEALSGLDFLNELEDSVEAKLESQQSPMW